MSLHFVDKEQVEEPFAIVKRPSLGSPSRPSRPGMGKKKEMYAAAAAAKKSSNKGLYQLLMLVGVAGVLFGGYCLMQKKE